jgi:hypothetical protein
MIKPLPALPFLLALWACADAPQPPPADPAKVKQLVASLEAEAAVPTEVDEKLKKADRIVAAVDRADPNRLNGAAERLLAR